LGRGIIESFMSRKSLTEAVEKYWHMGKMPGMHMKEEVVPAAIQRDQSKIEAIIHWANSTIALANAGKAETFKITYQPGPKETGNVIGNCHVCGKPELIRASRICCTVNGKNVYGKNGPLVGRVCEKHMVHIFEGIPEKDFDMYDQDARKKREAYDNIGTAFLTLDQLPAADVKIFKENGYDLSSKIAVDALKEIRKQIRKGDFSGLEREIDPGKNRDLVVWGIVQKRAGKVYDEDVYHTITLLQHRPQAVTQAMWANYLLYQWQERKWITEGEVQDIREDLDYISNLPGSDPLLKGYNQPELDDEVEPVKLFSKARWTPVTLRTLLYERNSITKAQTRAARKAAAGVYELRERHNREVINSYCNPVEFNKLLKNLSARYEIEKETYARAKKNGTRNPQTCWTRDTYNVLKGFFEEANKVSKQNEISIREYALKFLTMKDADEILPALYVEGRKLQMNADLRQNYVTIREASEQISKLEQRLERFVNSSIDVDARSVKKKLEPMHTSTRGFAEMLQDIRNGAANGILPTEYVQNGKLEQALEITKTYREDKKTAKQIDYLRQLEEELEVKIENIKAEPEISGNIKATRKTDARFKTQTFAGKKYFSPEQRKVIKELIKERAFGNFPHELKALNVKAAKEAIEFVKKFYKDNKVYTNWIPGRRLTDWGHSDVVFNEQPTPQEQWDGMIKFLPAKQYMRLAEEIIGFNKGETTKFTRITPELKENLDYFVQKKKDSYGVGKVHVTDYKGDASDAVRIANNPKTIITSDLASAIKKNYDNVYAHDMRVEQCKKDLEKEGYSIDDIKSRLERIKQRGLEHKVRLPNWNTLSSSATVTEALNELTYESIVLQKDYIHRLGEATRPSNIVLFPEDRHLYDNATLHYFDIVATSSLLDRIWDKAPEEAEKLKDDADHKLKSAFGPKRNNGKAILEHTKEKEEIYEKGKFCVPPYTWFGHGATREYVEKICARAEAVGDVYIKIVNARK